MSAVSARGGAPPTSGPALRATGLVVAGLFGLQGGGALATTLYAAVGVPGVVTLRLSLAAAVLLAFCRPGLRLPLRRWLLVCCLGGLLCTHHLAFYGAIDRIQLGAATTIEFLGPFLLSLALSRRRRHAVWACVALAGVVAVTRPSLGADVLGLGLAAIAGAAWATYIALSGVLARHQDPGSGLALAMAFGALLSLPFGLPLLTGHLTDPAVLATGACVAVLSSVGPYTLQLRALRRLPPRVLSVLLSTEPAVAAAVGLVALGQELSWGQWLGIAAVVTASVASALEA